MQISPSSITMDIRSQGRLNYFSLNSLYLMLLKFTLTTLNVTYGSNNRNILAATKKLHDLFSPSFCPSHLFHHVHVIISSWNYQELLPLTKVMPSPGKRSRSKVKVTEAKTIFFPIGAFPDRNSSLNSQMTMTWSKKTMILSWNDTQSSK